eukprot:17859_1
MGATVSNDQCSETNFAMTSLEINALQWIPIICFVVMWTVHKLMVSKFDMEPIIKMKQDWTPSTNVEPVDELMKKKELLTLVITKRLDADNHFRIRRRGSIEFVKSGMLAVCCAFLLTSPDFFYAAYWEYDPCCANYFYCRAFAFICMSLYLWEITMLEQYFNNHWSVYVHHWLVVFAGARVA